MQAKNNIFIAGDITAILEEKTAQTAESHAKIIIGNIRRLERNQQLKEYVSVKKPMIISLGNSAILETKYFSFNGKIPLLLKYFIERKTMFNH